MKLLGYLAAVVIGYLFGCSNMAYYISRLKGVDIRERGSGNLGASNTMVLLGWKAGILVGLHDIAKAAIAVLLVRRLFPALALAGAAAGVACVLGHIFPFWLHFRGGKGFASYLGMTLALDWKLALAIGLLVIAVTLITDYIVAGTVSTILAVPAWMFFVNRAPWVAAILCIATMVMLLKHRDNFIRILNGTETGIRRAHSGAERIDRRD